MFVSGSPSICDHVVDQETDLTENIFVCYFWVGGCSASLDSLFVMYCSSLITHLNKRERTELHVWEVVELSFSVA